MSPLLDVSYNRTHLLFTGLHVLLRAGAVAVRQDAQAAAELPAARGPGGQGTAQRVPRDHTQQGAGESGT